MHCIFAGAVGIAGISGTAAYMAFSPPVQKPSAQKTRPFAPHPPIKLGQADSDQMQAKIDFQNRQKEQTLRALELFRDASPKTKELFDFFNNHAFFTVPLEKNATQRILTADAPRLTPKEMQEPDPHEFEVTFMPEEYASRMPAPIIWQNPPENILRIAATIDVPEWLAILLYHELSHVYDSHIGGENPDDPDQWLQGEVEAHTLECELVKKWKPAEFSKLITDGLPLWKNKKTDAIIDLGHRLFPFPAKSVHAEALCNASLVTCVAFEDGNRAKKDLRNVYKRFMK